MVPWFLASCEEMTIIASLTSHMPCRVQTSTHIFTPFFHVLASSKCLIIPVNHQAPKLTHCGDPYCSEGHRMMTLPMRMLTHTSALQTAYSHFSLVQDVMKSALLLKLREGRWESSLSLTHPPTHTHMLHLTLAHSHTHPFAESSAQSQSSAIRA